MQAADEGPDGRPKVPLGVPSIDRRLVGGVRPGTSLLAAGPFGTGHHEFLRTAAILHGSWQVGAELFDLEYGEVPARTRQPSQVRYISLNETEEAFRRHIHDLADDEIAYPALDGIQFHSLAEEVASLGPIAPDGEGGLVHSGIEETPRQAFQTVFKEFDRVVSGGRRELVIIDAISDFFPITAKFLEPVDLYFISQTLCHVVSQSEAVLLAGADTDTLGAREVGLLKRSFEAILDFDWWGEGTRRRRTMTVTTFPEFAREGDPEDPVTFDLLVDRDRFGISEIQKIPA